MSDVSNIVQAKVYIEQTCNQRYPINLLTLLALWEVDKLLAWRIEMKVEVAYSTHTHHKYSRGQDQVPAVERAQWGGCHKGAHAED